LGFCFLRQLRLLDISLLVFGGLRYRHDDFAGTSEESTQRLER
jgi:hypothetical protein